MEQVYKNKSHGYPNLIYDCAMLEDLDLLAKRIHMLVSRVKALSAETLDMQRQLQSITDERDELARQLLAEKAQQRELKESLGSAQTTVQQTKARAQQEQQALQGTLDLFKQENESMQSSLKTREDEVRRLREVNQQARQRIDVVLEKLPGTLSQEAN